MAGGRHVRDITFDVVGHLSREVKASGWTREVDVWDEVMGIECVKSKKRHIVEDKVDEEMVTSIGSGVESSSLMLLLQVMARINIVNHSCFPDFWSSHLIALLIAATLELELSLFLNLLEM